LQLQLFDLGLYFVKKSVVLNLPAHHKNGLLKSDVNPEFVFSCDNSVLHLVLDIILVMGELLNQLITK